MKRSIKNRIATALLLAASFLGHNYKTGAVDHVDSRKFKNNKQSASFPLWAKIVIPVGSLSLLIGINKLRCRPRANISKDDIDKNVDNFINECENKDAKAQAQAFYEGRKAKRQGNIKKNHELLLKQFEKDDSKKTVINNFYKFVSNFSNDYYNSKKLDKNKYLSESYLLFSKCKCLEAPIGISNKGERILPTKGTKVFKSDNLIKSPDKFNKMNSNDTNKIWNNDFLKQNYEYVNLEGICGITFLENIPVKYIFFGLGVIREKRLKQFEIVDDSLVYSYESNDNCNDDELPLLPCKTSVKLDVENKELTIIYYGKYKHKNKKYDTQVKSVFDVSEWLKN